MSMFYSLIPQTCGEFGRKTLYAGELTDIPPVIYRLHAEFNIYPNDQLIAISNQFVCTANLAEKLQRTQPRLSGLQIHELNVTTTLDFRRNNSGKELSEMRWLKIVGKAGVEDFGMSADYKLVVSDKALSVIKSEINNCEISECELHT